MADDERGWKCPRCGESVPETFDVCWSCEYAKESATIPESNQAPIQPAVFGPVAQRDRHGCLTAYLHLMLMVNLLSFVAYLVIAGMAPSERALPEWALALMPVESILTIVCTIALLAWKRWGFFGLAASSVVGFIVNLMAGVNVGFALLGLVGVAILYGLLYIGADNKAWPHLD